MKAMLTSIILAGGKSKRFGQPKFNVKLKSKPLILYVMKKIYSISSEIIISVKFEWQKGLIERILMRNGLQEKIVFTIDDPEIPGILSGVKSALMKCKGSLAFITGCDLPFISPKTVKWLVNNIDNYDAIVPLWKNGFIEPLYSVYRVEPALKAIEKTIVNNDFSMRGLLKQIHVKYVSAEYLEELASNPIFFNINTKKDLVKAVKLISM